MKKIIYSLLALVLLAAPVCAQDKGTASFGVVKFNSVEGSGSAQSLAAAYIGNTLQIAIGGVKGTTAGVLTVLIDADQVSNFQKGTTLDLSSTGDEDQDGTANIIFIGTSVKIKGRSSTSTNVASNNDTQATGKFKVVSYNSSTKELRFTITGSAKPWTQMKGSLGNVTTTEIDKPIKVSAAAIITLPEN